MKVSYDVFDSLDKILVLSWLHEWNESGAFLNNIDLIFFDSRIKSWWSNFENNIGLESFLGGADFGSWANILFVSDGGSLSGSGFDNEGDAIFFDHSLDGLGGDGDSFFVGENFLGDADGEVFGIGGK